jgi:hypothetical protein
VTTTIRFHPNNAGAVSSSVLFNLDAAGQAQSIAVTGSGYSKNYAVENKLFKDNADNGNRKTILEQVHTPVFIGRGGLLPQVARQPRAVTPASGEAVARTFIQPHERPAVGSSAAPEKPAPAKPEEEDEKK